MKSRFKFHVLFFSFLFLPRLVYGLTRGETFSDHIKTFGLMIIGYAFGVFLARTTTSAFTRVNF